MLEQVEVIMFSVLRSEVWGISAEDEMDARINAIKAKISMIAPHLKNAAENFDREARP